jgi:hypothetical protein
MVGSATLTIVPSIRSISAADIITMAAAQRPGYAGLVPAVVWVSVVMT